MNVARPHSAWPQNAIQVLDQFRRQMPSPRPGTVRRRSPRPPRRRHPMPAARWGSRLALPAAGAEPPATTPAARTAPRPAPKAPQRHQTPRHPAPPPPTRRLGRPLRLLDLFPVRVHVRRRRHRHVPEHMGMPANQLRRQRVRHIVDREPAVRLGTLRRDSSVEQHLEQHVPDLLAERGHVAVLDCLRRLVRLFKQIAQQRRVRLLPIPRAGPAQRVHDPEQLEQPRPGHAFRRRAVRRRGVRAAHLSTPG